MSLERVQECYPTYLLVDLRLMTEHHAPNTRPRSSSRQIFMFAIRHFLQTYHNKKDSKISCRTTDVHAISSKTLSAQSTSPTLHIQCASACKRGQQFSYKPYSNCIFRLLHCSVLVLIWLVIAVVYIYIYIHCKLQ